MSSLYLPRLPIRRARLCQNPWPKPSRYTRAQRAGLGYQRKLSKELGSYFGRRFLSEPWIEYEDTLRVGHACPDGVLLFDDRVVLIEAKLSFNVRGWTQLQHLYHPIAQVLWGLPTVLVMATKNPKWAKPQVEDIGELETLGVSNPPKQFLWHWMP